MVDQTKVTYIVHIDDIQCIPSDAVRPCLCARGSAPSEHSTDERPASCSERCEDQSEEKCHVPEYEMLSQGQTIPKGTWVNGDIHYLLANDTLFVDPEEFRPERYLHEDGVILRKV